MIQYYRHCQEESQLVLDYATFHIFFPNDHKPKTVNNLTFSCDDIVTDPLEWKSYRHALLFGKNVYFVYDKKYQKWLKLGTIIAEHYIKLYRVAQQF